MALTEGEVVNEAAAAAASVVVTPVVASMEPVYYVGMIAQLLSYLSFLSGAKVCHLIYSEKSCAKLSPIPFLAGFNCMALWLRYGFLADEYEIIAVNFIGLTCQVIYLAFFVAYSRQKARIFKQWLILILFLGFLFWIIERSPKDERIFIGGSFASLAGLIACSAPLATIQDVLKTRCVSSMPFPIIISTFVVTLSWLIFGFLKGDTFIVFSNFIAVIISGAQLSLFLIYPSKLAYERLSPSNKKSYDLIKLLNSEEDEVFAAGEMVYNNDQNYLEAEIDTNQDYKQTLAKIMSQIYAKREQMSRSTSKVFLLVSAM